MKKPTLQHNKRFRQGVFTPKNPDKFHNKGQGIIYRSGLELRYLNYFDMNPNVLFVASEEFSIDYISLGDLDEKGRPKRKRYFPDFLIKVKKSNGEIQTFVIEIKPKSQTIPPPKQKNTAKYAERLLEWQKNKDKWKAATLFCESRGLKFEIMTEETIKIRK
jgi:hypothetical protein